MTKINVYVVRHGQTIFNIFNKLQGWSNSPLTEKGSLDAKETAAKLKNIRFNAAFASDTTRAIDTAQAILAENAVSHPQLQTSPYFREEFYGYYEGNNMDETWYVAGAPHGVKTFKELIQQYSMDKSKDFLKEADPFKMAEDSQEYWVRLNKGLSTIKSDSGLVDDDNVLLISHGNTILSLVDRFGEGQFDISKRPRNGSVTKLLLNDDDVSVVYFNRQENL